MTQKKLFAAVGLVATGAVIVFALVHHSRQTRAGSAATAGGSVSGPHLTWKFNTDNNSAVGSIALGKDGTVFVGANNAIYAVAPDGTRKWKTTLAGFSYLAESDDGTLYVAGSYGSVFSVLPDGTLSWNPRMGLIGFGAPPAIGRNGYVLFANTVSDLYAFRPDSSQSPDWSQSTFREGIVNANASLPGQATVGMHVRNAPAIWRDETIALPRQHWIHLFDAEGSQMWLSELTPGQLGPAALADDGTIYVADDRTTFFAVTRSGDIKWKYETDGLVQGSAVVGSDATIYFATPNSVYALAPDGTVKWQTKAPQQNTTAPTLAEDGTVYVGGYFGFLALRADGSIKGNIRIMSATGPATIGSDGTIYLPCGYSWVCAVRDEGSPLAHSPWPKMFHDPANTSRILTLF